MVYLQGQGSHKGKIMVNMLKYRTQEWQLQTTKH